MRIASIIITIIMFTACASSRRTTDGVQEETIGTVDNPTATAIGTDKETDERMNSNRTDNDTKQRGLFAFLLLDHICRSDKNENICISPASVKCALAMAANGAQGQTLEQILSTIEATRGLGYLNNSNLYTAKVSRDETTLSIANSIWVNKNTPVKEKFIADNQKYHKAEVVNAPFNDSTLSAINDWCKEKTNGKITSILDRLDNQTKMILLNAIYLRGRWRNEFYKESTHDAPFTKADGTTTNVKMMSQTLTTAYNRDDKVSIISLPFNNSSVAMQFVLPHKGTSIVEAARHLAHNYDTLCKSMNHRQRIDLSLPRFKCEYNTGLKSTLQALGMSDAFDSRANFAGISDEPLYIDEIMQKTYLKIDEEGAEAAAVTSVLIGAMAMRPTSDPIELKFDRPFIYLIVDRGSENILFVGKSDNPQE